MRTTIALLFVGLCALAIAGPVQKDHTGIKYRVADKAFLVKQKDILRLFKYVFQPNYYKDQAEIAKNYKIEEHIQNYSNPKVVKEFLYLYKQGFLPRGEVFSVFYDVHRQQAVALFNVLYYSKDYATFYKTACWAREYMNEGMFVYAMHVAVLHHHELQGIVLPPIYEIYPQFFVNSEVIAEAYKFKMANGDYKVMHNNNYHYKMHGSHGVENKQYGHFYGKQNQYPGSYQGEELNKYYGKQQGEQEQYNGEETTKYGSYYRDKDVKYGQYQGEQTFQGEYQGQKYGDYQGEQKQMYTNYNGQEKIYHVYANYSGWYLNTHPGQYDMSYYTEDVGLNAFYYYFHVDYPFWMGGEEFGLNKDRRGELYYFVHQQLLARYYQERLSNGYGSIPVFDYEEPIKTGYVSSMRYPNGLHFPSRPAYTSLVHNPHNQGYTFNAEDNVFLIQKIEDYERRIRDAIDSGYIYTEEGQKINIYDVKGFDLLGKIIESNPDSPNTQFYGALQVIARQVLGYSAHPVHEYKVHPSVLEHFETALRDPIFYQFYKRMTYYFLQYKSHLPNYTYSQLHYPGVSVEKVEVDKLVTYFDHFDFDITNALYVSEQEYEQSPIQVHARQYRLNHQPFTYKIAVNSDKNTDVVVRVFLGPKYDEQGHIIPLNENRINFVELDKFVYTLNAGKNMIVRDSRQGQTVKDRTTYRALYQHVMAALEGNQEFHLDMSEAHNGFPNRFILPKGTMEGQVYQFYVYVSPYKGVHEKPTYDKVISAGVGSGMRYVDELPFGYPFDRQIDNEETFFVPNSYVEDVVIFHKTESQMKYHQY